MTLSLSVGGLTLAPKRKHATPADASYATLVDTLDPVVHFRFNGPQGAQADRLNSSRTVTPLSQRYARLRAKSMTDGAGGSIKFNRDGIGRATANAALNTHLNSYVDWNKTFTLVAWISHELDSGYATNTAFSVLEKAFADGTFQGWDMNIRKFSSPGTCLRFEMHNGTTSMALYGTNTVVASLEPRMLAVTNDGTGTTAGIKLYLDGVELTTRTISAAGPITSGTCAGSADFQIGTKGTESGTKANSFQGNIGDVSVHSRVLTAQEISALFAKKHSWSYNDTASIQSSPTQPVAFIWDDDIDSDIDGVQNLALIAAADKAGEIDLKGMIVTSNYTYSAAAADILLKDAATRISHAKLATIPMGAWQGSTSDSTTLTWPLNIVDQFRASPAAMRQRTEFTASVTQYRTLLAAAADNSIVIGVGGTWHSIDGLISSAGDGIDARNGWDLMTAKVRMIVYCGTSDDGTQENNNFFGLTEAKRVFRNCPVPILMAPKPSFQTPTFRIKNANNTHATDPWKRAWGAYCVENSIAQTSERGFGDMMPILYAMRGKGGGLLNLTKWQHAVMINANGNASRNAYPANDYGVIAKLASDGTIQSTVQALIDSVSS